MRLQMVPVPLPPGLHDADDDKIRQLLCTTIDSGRFTEAMWFRCADRFLLASLAGPRDAARDTWAAATFRLSQHEGLRARFRVGVVDDPGKRSVCVFQWAASEAWTAASRRLGPDGLPTGPWEITRGQGYDALSPGLLRWVDAGSRGVTDLDQLLAHTRLRPPIRRDEFDLPFDPARNVARLTEQLGAYFDALVAAQGLAFRIVSLVRGRRCVVYEVDLDVQVPFDDFVRTVAAREPCVAAAVLSPERTVGAGGEVVHEARLIVESAGRRAERRARIGAGSQASVLALGKVYQSGWIGVAPRNTIALTSLGDTPSDD